MCQSQKERILQKEDEWNKWMREYEKYTVSFMDCVKQRDTWIMQFLRMEKCKGKCVLEVSGRKRGC